MDQPYEPTLLAQSLMGFDIMNELKEKVTYNKKT